MKTTMKRVSATMDIENMGRISWLIYNYSEIRGFHARQQRDFAYWARPEVVANTAFFDAMAGIAAVAALITLRRWTKSVV
jgi:hypothetical protein